MADTIWGRKVDAGQGYESLARIQSLVHHLWDATALMCLDRQPLRYTELHRRMSAMTACHLTESELTRTRHRLVNTRMIRESRSPAGSKVYFITDLGRHRLEQIRILLEVAPRIEAARA
ncbi:hypothetical protein ACQP2X_39705 [Actinoplanes sp. CA-131856]